LPSPDDRYRRILVIGAPSGEGPFIVPFPDFCQRDGISRLRL
jgi:hypothetical protein